jgi:Protein of unknown function (DUF4012)/Sortase domain
MPRLAVGARVVWAISAAVVIGLAAAGWWVASLASRGQEAQQHLLTARTAISAAVGGEVAAQPGSGDTPRLSSGTIGQLGSACAEAAQADALLRDVGGQMHVVMPLVEALGAVPGVGSRTRAQTAALETGTQLAAAGTALCSGMQPLAALLGPADHDSTGGPPSARGALRALLAARPALVEAADRLDRTLDALRAVSDADLDAAARPGIEALRTRLPTLVQSLRDTTALLDLLGARGERTFLLVSQNPDELRATGGYIGSAGVAVVGDGSVRLLEYGSSRAYDTPTDLRARVPRPFAGYLGDYWELAGANWTPSFPDVARQLEYFYSLSHPEQRLDGVVALDQFGLARLLEVLGPVAVPDYGERVGAADLQAALDRHVHAGDAFDEAGRKQFTAALSAAVLEQVLNAPRPLVPRLVTAVRAALDEQHLLVSVSDATAAAVLARRHWDGALLPATSDALMIVDTDVVGSKQSQGVKRDVAYHVDLGATDTPRAQLTITYTNLGRPELRPDVVFIPNYRTFVRAYAPAGAELLASSGFVSPPAVQQECGRAVFGGEVLIPMDSTVRVDLAYRLPAQAADPNSYELLVQQQPGVPPGTFAVSVAGAASTATLQRESATGRHYRWRLDSAESGGLRDMPLPEAAVGGCGAPIVAAEPIAAPTWLDIPAARVSAAIVELGVEPDGTMEAPATPDVVGWYRMSARAGQPGNSVFSGHVDWGRGTAVFWGLRDLVPSDPIVLRGADGVEHRYLVEWNRVFDRNDPSATELVRGWRGSVLTLITCDGTYDRSIRDYSGRRIVRAVLSD